MLPPDTATLLLSHQPRGSITSIFSRTVLWCCDGFKDYAAREEAVSDLRWLKTRKLKVTGVGVLGDDKLMKFTCCSSSRHTSIPPIKAQRCETREGEDERPINLEQQQRENYTTLSTNYINVIIVFPLNIESNWRKSCD